MPEGNQDVVASAQEIWQRLSNGDDPTTRRPAELIRAASAKLARAGLSSPAVDARCLLRCASGLNAAQLLTSSPLETSIVDEFWQLIERRAAGVPVQHLTGVAPFRHAEIVVGPGVFIPRPETELVAGAAIDEVLRLQCGQLPVQVVELCAGSGAISRSILDEAPGVNLTAVEISADALPYLHRNLSGQAEASGAVDVLHADLAELLNLRPELAGGVDVVVVNPPYVPTAQRLPLDVHADPAVALFGGLDGLDVIRELLPVAAELLRPGGLLIMEHGDDQGSQVVDLLIAAGFSEAEDHYDLTERPRFSTARRAALTDDRTEEL